MFWLPIIEICLFSYPGIGGTKLRFYMTSVVCTETPSLFLVKLLILVWVLENRSIKIIMFLGGGIMCDLWRANFLKYARDGFWENKLWKGLLIWFLWLNKLYQAFFWYRIDLLNIWPICDVKWLGFKRIDSC